MTIMYQGIGGIFKCIISFNPHINFTEFDIIPVLKLENMGKQKD